MGNLGCLRKKELTKFVNEFFLLQMKKNDFLYIKTNNV